MTKPTEDDVIRGFRAFYALGARVTVAYSEAAKRFYAHVYPLPDRSREIATKEIEALAAKNDGVNIQDTGAIFERAAQTQLAFGAGKTIIEALAAAKTNLAAADSKRKGGE